MPGLTGFVIRYTRVLIFQKDLLIFKRFLFGIAGIAMLTLSASAAHAQTIAVNTAANGFDSSDKSTMGFSFSVTSTQTVTGLAIFDYGSNGLAESHPVGLWDSSQTLLSSTTVSTANSTALASNSTLGNWRATTITPVVLTPGTYYVGAFYNTLVDRYVYGGAMSSISGFTYLSDAFNSGPSIAFPEGSSGRTAANGGFLGATIVTSGVAVVPEANTAALLGLALPMIGTIAIARRKKK